MTKKATATKWIVRSDGRIVGIYRDFHWAFTTLTYLRDKGRSAELVTL